MSVKRPVTILGGIPVIAEVSFTTDYWGEHDASVEDLFWRKRDGTAGKSIPQHLFDKALVYGDDYQGCNIIEQVSEQLSYESWRERELAAGRDPDAMFQLD